MSYKNTLEYLESLQPKDFRMELQQMADACHILDNPENSFPCVHIGGTNGKGSTSAFLADILKGNGYKVGLLTSPHLIDVRERIQINRQIVPKEELTRIVGEIKSKLPDERMLSFFEMITLAAFVYFRDSDVDIAVIETGLGGRLDATNVVTPLVSVITSISFDHTQHLGSTIAEITREKCGIIKRGIPTVVAYQPKEAMEVIRHACDDAGSPLCLTSPEDVSDNLGLAGEHQRQNAACAVEAAQILSQCGFKIANVEKSLAATKWPGRIETVKDSPRVILDAAHNVAGAESLAAYVREKLPKEKSVLVLGVLADKDVSGIIRPLAPLFREVVCVRAPSPRAASPKDIAAVARSSGAKITMNESAREAIKTTLKSLGKGDNLVISGSLTVVGEAKALFKK